MFILYLVYNIKPILLKYIKMICIIIVKIIFDFKNIEFKFLIQFFKVIFEV